MIDDGLVFHFDNVYNENPMDLGFFQLIQIGDISCRKGYLGPLHQQICYEISYIASGSGEFFIDDIAYPVKKGDIFINYLGEMHYTKSSVYDPLRFYYLGFNFDVTSDRYDSYDLVINMFKNRKSPVFKDKFNIHGIFVNAFNEFINDNALKLEIIESCIQQILCYTYRNYAQEFGDIYSNEDKKRVTEEILYDVIHYIDNNYLNINKLTDISDRLNYSYPYLSLIFSNETGITIKKYLSDKKIEHAERLLHSELSITEISELLGYESIHTFSRIFKKKTGVSPSQYRFGLAENTDGESDNSNDNSVEGEMI